VSRAEGIFEIDQCTHFRDGGVAGDCDSSMFRVRDVRIKGVRGIIVKDVAARLKCSPKAPCEGIEMEDVEVVRVGGGGKVVKSSCRNVIRARGISCGI